MEQERVPTNPTKSPSTTPERQSFKAYYEDICQRIRASGKLEVIMNEFEVMRSDLQRVTYVHNMEEFYIPDFEKSSTGKSFEDSLKYEKEYDALVPDETLTAIALKAISKSIQTTQPDDKKALAVRYMKRSWASLLRENFDLAEKDAKRSLSFGVPSEITWNSFEILGHCYAKQSLFKKSETFFKQALDGLRKSECSSEVKGTAAGRICLVFKSVKGRNDLKGKQCLLKETKYELPTVTHGQNKVLESATSAVHVVVNAERGRGLYASQDLKPGDTIIVEEAFAAALNDDCFGTNCNICFKRLTAPVPCHTCSTVWFCDEECQKESVSQQHALECRILSLMHDESISKMANLVFRTLTKQSWKWLEKEKNLLRDLASKNNFDDKLKEKYSSTDYKTVFCLETNSDKRSFGDMFKRCLTAVFLAYCFKEVNFFLGCDAKEEELLFIASLCMRHLQGSSCNAYGVTECISDISNVATAEVIEIGGAIYPTISLTNHSCWPNVVRISFGTTCVLRVTRRIKRGTEIFDNYGPYFHVTRLSERQEVLESQYMFECKCEACLENWPLYPHSKELLTFKCPEQKCGHPNSDISRSSQQCIQCGNNSQYNNLILEINRQINQFKEGLKHLKEGSLDKALKSLLDFQCFLDKHAKPPGKYCSDTQEAIRQCFSFKGNSYSPH